MAKRIISVGKKAERIVNTGKVARRIDPAEFAKALGAEPTGVKAAGALDPIALGAIGNELLKRLRSTGGRPALEGADQICKVPLSAEDIAALEKIAHAVEQKKGTRPSLGQVASVILRKQLEDTRRTGTATGAATADELAGCFFQTAVTASRR